MQLIQDDGNEKRLKQYIKIRKFLVTKSDHAKQGAKL
jgi:hypothetical protein